MNKVFLLFILGLSLIGCNSDTESKGVDAILGFYGGKASYSKGMIKTTDADELQGKYYEIKLSDVDKIKQHFNEFDMPASNCAYLFFHSLSNSEKDDYAFVRIILEIEGAEHKYDFETKQLASFESALSLGNIVIDDIKKKDYDSFIAKGNLQGASKDEWSKSKTLMAAVDDKYGDVNEFSVQGFEKLDRNLQAGVKHLVKVSGVLVRAKQSTDFSFIVEPTATRKDNYLYGFDFSK